MSLAITLGYLYPGINLAPGGDCEIVEGRISVWRLHVPQPTAEDVAAAEMPAARAAAAQQIKQRARTHILAKIPEWKQANMTARAVELVALGQTSGPEWAAMLSAWDWIKAVRAHSDALETEAQTNPGVDTTQGWPE